MKNMYIFMDLLHDVDIDDIHIDHVWVKATELNNLKKYRKGINFIFDALVSLYQKINGLVGIGLVDLKRIQCFLD